jgi:hypothetical protein
MLARTRVVEQAIGLAGDRITLGDVRIGERRCREHREPVRRRAAFVEAQPCGAGDVRHHAVEHLAVLLVGVEAVVQKRPQKAARL